MSSLALMGKMNRYGCSIWVGGSNAHCIINEYKALYCEGSASFDMTRTSMNNRQIHYPIYGHKPREASEK